MTTEELRTEELRMALLFLNSLGAEVRFASEGTIQMGAEPFRFGERIEIEVDSLRGRFTVIEEYRPPYFGDPVAWLLAAAMKVRAVYEALK